MELNDRLRCEIDYRKTLMQKVFKSPRLISSEEKLWLQTHPAYSETYGYPHLEFDIIELSKPECKITCKLVKNSCSKLARAVFIPAADKGYIDQVSAPVYVKGKMSESKKLKSFSPYFDIIGQQISFVCHSPLKKLEVLFECEVGEGKYVHMMPSTITPFFVMKKEQMGELAFRYICSTQQELTVDSFIFDVELMN